MPKFRYEAITDSGLVQRGIMEGNNQRNVEERLRDIGLFPKQVSLLVEKEKRGEIEFSYRIPTKDLAVFCNQLGVILRAGITILQSLDIMAEQTENKKLKAVILDVLSRIQKGQNVSSAFREHSRRFPEIFLSMLESGEASGNMDKALIRMGSSLTKNYKLAQKVKGAMIYPLILVIISIIVVIFLLIVIVPTFARLYDESGAQLPFLTRMMLGLGDFMANNVILLILVILFAVVISRILLRVESIRIGFDRFKLKIPVFGKLLMKIITARYTQNLSALLSSGIPMTQAIEITSHSVGNAFVSGEIYSIIADVRAGKGLYEPLKDLKLFSPMVVQMTQLGEESGTLDELLAQTADFFESEADSATTKLTALVEPIIIVFLGVMVLTIVLSVLLPMFGMYSMMGG